MVTINFSLAQIEAFACVCEAGSLSTAAKRLQKNRTTVGELVDTLEINLGYELFDRSKRPLQLTEEGQQLYAQARLFLQEAEIFNQVAMQMPDKIHHQITLCYDCFTPLTFLQRLINTLAEQQIKVNLLCVERSQAEQMLAEGMADIGVYQARNRMINSRFKWRSLGTIELAVYAQQHFFNQSKEISMTELVSTNQFIPLVELPDYLAKRLRISDYTQIITDVSLLKKLLNEGKGWAILPTHLFKESLGEIKLFNTALGHNIEQVMVVLWTPTANKKIEQIVQHVQASYDQTI